MVQKKMERSLLKIQVRLLQGATFNLSEEPMDWTLPNLPQLPYGHYFVNFTGYRKGHPLTFNVCAEIIVIPRPS